MHRVNAAGRVPNAETGAPPHAERPAAASPATNTRPRRRRTLALALSALAIAVTAAGCIGSGPAPAPSHEELVIHEVFDPLGVADKALSIAWCESGMNALAGFPDATYKGLFQLGPHLQGTVDAYGGQWFDARTNALVARDLYLSRGNWSAWTCA